jgi:Protein of unknown function (DUF2799)
MKVLGWRLFLSLILALSALLSGCATMSADECKVANWGDVGLRDGLDGAALSKLDARVKDCAEAKVAVDTLRYLQGRDQGLLQFCQIEKAAPLGLGGGNYNNVCPVGIDGEFRRRFKLGRDVHDARQAVKNLEGNINNAEDRLRAAPNDEDRRRAREALRDLDYEIRRSRDRQRDAERALDRLR